MKNILSLLPLLALFASCIKTKPAFNGIDCTGNCLILTGKVTDSPSSAGLSNVELKFYYRPSGYTIVYDPSVYLGKTTTDADGAYKFQFDGTKYKTRDGNFRMEATKNGYFYYPSNDHTVKTFYLDSSNFNINFNQDFPLFRTAKLAVRFKATNVTNFQYLMFTYRYDKSETGIILNGNKAIDTTIIYTTAGDIPSYIKWSAMGNGVNIQKKDTVLATWNGTASYEVSL